VVRSGDTRGLSRRHRSRSPGLLLGGDRDRERVPTPASLQPNGRSIDDEHQNDRDHEGRDDCQVDHTNSGGMVNSIIAYNERRGRNSREVRWIFAR
jgi:hypothetical protein